VAVAALVVVAVAAIKNRRVSDMTKASKPIKNIRSALALASCAVLGSGAAPVMAKGEPGSWDFDLAGLSIRKITAV